MTFGMTTREILADEYFRVVADDRARVVWLIRSTTAFPSLESIEQSFARVSHAVSTTAPEWSLLIDSREGPLRNDPAFEEILARARGRIVDRYARVAVLVKSAVGKLQVARYAREDHKSPRVFDDEDAALTYLMTPRGESKRPPKP
jgi:hypothetical protein